ncbi:transcription factor CYCLOIDEA-like isoform X2 [Quercus robur]|uniref:transcription factor CYCLOIDEA-like isoform X2 n=1 Tax=Quercus robur TaxID=38942 RepID=UPI00216303AE|nr:transcription factor CYCLOIDEA-like isoform X2 [Quercus robur]
MTSTPVVETQTLLLDPSYEDNDVFFQHIYDLLFHQHSFIMRAEDTVTEAVANSNMMNSNNSDINVHMAEHIPRKRSRKRDQRIKINTAQGPRERRMRLSVKVAPDFFKLQDLLGCDTASKTLEWLLINSKDEIKKLEIEKKHSFSVGVKGASSTSKCQTVSGIDPVAIHDRDQQNSVLEEKTSKKEKKIGQSVLRKSAFHPLVRESRKKARERARERARVKMRSRVDESKLCEVASNCNLSQLGSWSKFESGEESGTQSHNMNTFELRELPESEEGSVHAGEHLGASKAMVDDDYLLIFNSHNTGILPERQFADFEFFDEPWDAYK